MDHKTLYIRNVREKREYLKVIDELPCLVLAALDIEREDRAAAVREISLVKLMVRMIRKRRMIYLCYACLSRRSDSVSTP